MAADHSAPARRQLRGVDFSSAPTRRKPIVLAQGELLPASPDTRPPASATVRLHALRRLPSLTDYAAALAEPGPWVGAFDLPFGLPRELVETLGWPTSWPALIAHYRGLDRADIRARFAAFCNARPAGRKFAHRACDGPAGSSPSMKWVNPPVAWMLHAGVPPLIDVGCDLPGLLAGDPDRVALEAYPGLIARELLGRRSYKSDTPHKQDATRHAARTELVDALQAGRTRLALRLDITPEQRNDLIGEPQGDLLDATICLMLAGWASLQPSWGRPANADPLEGWIVGAPTT